MSNFKTLRHLYTNTFKDELERRKQHLKKNFHIQKFC